jgi:site-specific recombinase XerD
MKKNEMRFYQLLRDFLTEYIIIKRNFSEKTSKSYRQTMKLFRNYFREIKNISFEHMDFSCFSRSNIYDFILWLKDNRGNSTQTLNLRLAAIKSFLKYASEEDIELTNLYLEVCTIHAFKNTKKTHVEYLNKSQLKLVFSLPDISTRLGRRNRFFMLLAYETGARMQELLDLRLSSIIRNDTGIRIRIHGKGNKIRYVPLFGTMIKHLQAYLDEFHKKDTTQNISQDAFLFYTIHNSRKTQMTPGTADFFLKKYAKLANNTDVSFPKNLHAHMFRHSIAMAMYKNGIPISYIRDFLGHHSIETTTIYSYADDETIAKVLEAVNNNDSTNSVIVSQKNWKGKEQFLLEYCGFG